jgi:hypothetical protein
MKSFIKQMIRSVLPEPPFIIRAYGSLIKNNDSYLHTTGWMLSLKENKPVNQAGDPIPWMNYPVISLLEERLTNDLNLFEYGSGYSTLFYAKRVRKVTSVEYDQKWFQVVNSQVPNNVTIIYRKKDVDGDYCRAIASTGEQYDVVIVDGRDRMNCVKQSLLRISPYGVILLDDSQLEKYQSAIVMAREMGFKTLHLEGLKATGHKMERTTIYYRQQNCLGI